MPPPTGVMAVSRFGITIDGTEIATFQELVGITQEVGLVEMMDGTDPHHVRQLPGRVRPPTLTLRRSLTRGMELAAWHQAVASGDLSQAKRSATLTMYDAAGKPVARYGLEDAWPSKLEITAVRSGATSTLMETVTLLCEQLERLSP